MATLAVDTQHGLAPRLRLPAWMLILQILLWLPAVLLVTSVPLSPTSSWTSETQAQVRTLWIIHQGVMLLAALVGTTALVMVARALIEMRPTRLARAGMISAMLTIALWLVWGVLRFSLLTVSAPTLGEIPAYQASGLVVIPLTVLTALATCLISFALRQDGIARRTGLIVGILSGLCMVVGPFVPPFVYGLLWLPIGIALLRARPTLA